MKSIYNIYIYIFLKKKVTDLKLQRKALRPSSTHQVSVDWWCQTHVGKGTWAGRWRLGTQVGDFPSPCATAPWCHLATPWGKRGASTGQRGGHGLAPAHHGGWPLLATASGGLGSEHEGPPPGVAGRSANLTT